jgi:ABC-2 type transport system permease protein
VEPRRFFNLTWLIAATDFKLTYFGSVLGYLWSLVRPLLFFGVLYVVFAVIVSFGKGIQDFPVLLLMNIVLISFFQEATSASIPSVVLRENLVRKMQFPRLVIPMATVLNALMHFGLNLIAVFVFMLAYGVKPRLTWLLFPLVLLPLVLLVIGLAMLLSSLYVRYRDVSPIWGVISQVMFYGSPIFYTIERVAQHHAARYYLFNPIAVVMQQARHWMVGGTPGAASWMGGKAWLLVPAGIVTICCVLGYVVFSRMAPEIAEQL